MATITLIQYAGLTRDTTLSPPCGKVHMALRAKGLPYDVKNLSSPAAARRYNPRGRVPVLRIDGALIVDSRDIVTALDERFPERPLTPQDPKERARAHVLEAWADESLYFQVAWLRWGTRDGFERLRGASLSRLPIPMRWLVPPIARRMALKRFHGQGVGLKGEEVVRRELEEGLDALEALLEPGPFLIGEALTRADIALAAIVDQMCIDALTPELARSVTGRPRIGGWRERVHAEAPPAC